MKAIQIEKFGPPEVMTVVDLAEPLVGGGQVLMRVSHSGINYADIYLVENSYPEHAKLPFIPGTEVVGQTADGRRLASLIPHGGYAQRVAVWEHMSFAVPDNVGDGQALALLVQGITAWHLLRTSARLTPGESVVVHAAAGGVGSLAVQLAKEWGAGRVIATASNPDKRRLAESLGADAVVDSAPENLTQRLHAANRGKPVDVVLEMVGGAVFEASYAALGPFGRLITYGAVCGADAKAPNLRHLMRQSRAIAGFWLPHVLRDPVLTTKTVTELFGLAASGRLRPLVGNDYPLTQAPAAHNDLKARRSVGKLVLDPSR